MSSRAVDRPRSALSDAWRRLGVPLAIALLITQLPAVAFADHGGREVGSILNCDRPVTPPRCTSVGDDLRHYVFFDESLTAELSDAMRTAMAEAYSAPTKLSLIEQSRLGARTDVIAYSADYGDNGAAAWVYCPTHAPKGENPSGDRWCRHQELIFNTNPRYAVFFDDDASREHVACHELGHTLGLRHWGNPPETDGPAGATCMNSNTPNGPTRLHQTDIDHINDYPYTVGSRGPLVLPVPEVDVIRVVGQPRVAHGGWLAGASEVEEPASLEALVGSADLVVHGRVAGVEPGRTFGPDRHPLHYAAVTVEILERLSGTTAEPGADRITVEVPMYDGPQALSTLRDRMLGSERLLFLRNKGTSAAMAGLPEAVQRADRQFYRLVTLGSEVVSAGGLAAPGSDESAILDPLAGRGFGEAVASVRRIAGR